MARDVPAPPTRAGPGVSGRKPRAWSQSSLGKQGLRDGTEGDGHSSVWTVLMFNLLHAYKTSMKTLNKINILDYNSSY